MQSVLVGYSGGLDSHVLLHQYACQRANNAPLQLSAIHVHHGLQAQADQWAEHCDNVCRALEIPLRIVKVSITLQPGDSLEEQARLARYRTFAQHLPATATLATAHTADDQAETLLLQLLRGAGVAGLSAMPSIKPFADGWHARPLLQQTRAELHAYALEHQLTWIEDDSNSDLRFARNYLRHQVMPLLVQRWPGAIANINRSARHCASAHHLVESIAAADWQTAKGANQQQLDLSTLAQLPAERQICLLRYWIKQQGFRLPGTAKLQEIIRQLIYARSEQPVTVEWADYCIQRAKGALTVFRRVNSGR